MHQPGIVPANAGRIRGRQRGDARPQPGSVDWPWGWLRLRQSIHGRMPPRIAWRVGQGTADLAIPWIERCVMFGYEVRRRRRVRGTMML